MNNQLKKTFDSHNNATIIESKPNTKFGFCMFLQNKGGFKIQTSLRHSHIGENDNYFGLDFRIDSDTLYNLFPLEECYLSFIVDGKITKLSIAHQLIGRGEKMNNFSYQVWFTVPINRDLLKGICNSESLEIRINTQIGFIDVNFEDLDTKKDFILMSRHFYNGVYESSEFNEDLKTNIRIQKSSLLDKINSFKSPWVFFTFIAVFIITFLILFLSDIGSSKKQLNEKLNKSKEQTLENEDISNKIENQNKLENFQENDEPKINMSFCDCYNWLSERENLGQDLNKDIKIYKYCKKVLEHGNSAIEQNEFDKKLGDCN
jgi:hypothetical protein